MAELSVCVDCNVVDSEDMSDKDVTKLMARPEMRGTHGGPRRFYVQAFKFAFILFGDNVNMKLNRSTSIVMRFPLPSSVNSAIADSDGLSSSIFLDNREKQTPCKQYTSQQDRYQ